MWFRKKFPINDIETTITVHVYCLVLKYLLVGLLSGLALSHFLQTFIYEKCCKSYLKWIYNYIKKEPFFQAYDVAVEHFLSALNFQAGPGLATGPTKQNNTQDLKRKVMSDNVWSSLRLSLGLMGKRELYPLIEQRNLEKLNEILKK